MYLHKWPNHLRDDRWANIAVNILPLSTLGCLVSVFINVHVTAVVWTILFQRYRLVDQCVIWNLTVMLWPCPFTAYAMHILVLGWFTTKTTVTAAIFAQLVLQSPLTLHCATHPPPKKICPFPYGTWTSSNTSFCGPTQLTSKWHLNHLSRSSNICTCYQWTHR